MVLGLSDVTAGLYAHTAETRQASRFRQTTVVWLSALTAARRYDHTDFDSQVHGTRTSHPSYNLTLVIVADIFISYPTACEGGETHNKHAGTARHCLFTKIAITNY